MRLLKSKHLKRLTQEELQSVVGGIALEEILKYLLKFGINFVLNRQLQNSIINFCTENDLPSLALGFSNFFAAKCIANGVVTVKNVVGFINNSLNEITQVGQNASKSLDFSDLFS